VLGGQLLRQQVGGLLQEPRHLHLDQQLLLQLRLCARRVQVGRWQHVGEELEQHGQCELGEGHEEDDHEGHHAHQVRRGAKELSALPATHLMPARNRQ